ncbi:hypothetical protein NUW54_g8438 [Trametes sanguinea]|uniref:Uncharacterized protein n=1 Tax=Trametes sanguinea TaxID=158606 RepID=A0ACC1PF29_9APHY|nr:hypothetical protein NUW54_g8438 [Trametes sanguinea]
MSSPPTWLVSSSSQSPSPPSYPSDFGLFSLDLSHYPAQLVALGLNRSIKCSFAGANFPDVSHWGSEFRKKYGSLGIVRAFLPRGTPIVALSATLTSRVRRDVISKLHFPKKGDSFLNVGNDRPNISIVVRACEHPMNSYADLNFIIPEHCTTAASIPKTYVYADNIHLGTEIVGHLTSLIASQSDIPPEDIPGLVRPFNAVMSSSYRTAAMKAFQEGDVRILVCTDAAGMVCFTAGVRCRDFGPDSRVYYLKGCNISDVDLVVQWKLPSTLSSFIQRAGRAARAPSRHGMAVLLVERSAFSPPQRSKPACRRQDPGSVEQSARSSSLGALASRQSSREYANAHGLRRGTHAGSHDTPPSGDQPSLDPDSPDEGILAFVQSVRCRRDLWLAAYDSPRRESSTPCCDICDPSLLDRTRPGPNPRTKRLRRVKRGKPVAEFQHKLYAWRQAVFKRDHHGAQWDCTGILSDSQVQHLTSVGHPTRAKLSAILEASWVWWDEYADELVALMHAWPVPFLPLKPRARTNQSKRSRGIDNEQECFHGESDSQSGRKRVRREGGPDAAQQLLSIHWQPLETPHTYSEEVQADVDLNNPYPRISWDSPNQLTPLSFTGHDGALAAVERPIMSPTDIMQQALPAGESRAGSLGPRQCAKLPIYARPFPWPPEYPSPLLAQAQKIRQHFQSHAALPMHSLSMVSGGGSEGGLGSYYTLYSAGSLDARNSVPMFSEAN